MLTGDQAASVWLVTALATVAIAMSAALLFLGLRRQAARRREVEWAAAFRDVARQERPIVAALREFDEFMVLLLEGHGRLVPGAAGPLLADAWGETRRGLIELLDAVEQHWSAPPVRRSMEMAGLAGETGALKAALLVTRVRRATTIMRASDGMLGKKKKRKAAAGAAKSGNVVIKSLIAAANATVVLAPLALPAHAAMEVKDFAEVLLEHGED